MMKDIKTIVAKNILFYRKQRKLSQRALAEKIGVRHNTISSWESCINSVDIDNLFKICKALDISVNTMLGIDEQDSIYTDKEKELIQAYREHPEMQQAVDKMLDISHSSSTAFYNTKRKSDIDAVFHTNSTDDDSAALALQITTVKN